MKVSYVVSDDFISLVIDNVPYNVVKSNKNFDQIKEKIKIKEYENIIDLISDGEAINKKGNKFGIQVKGSYIFYNGEKLDNSLVDQIIKTKDQGYEFDNLVKFLENLMKNTSEEIRKELYDWIASSKNISITSDGAFLAYKKVRNDYLDIYSGKMDNSIGNIVIVDKEKVDTNRNNTCSFGLHFCSYSYLDHYSSCSNDKCVILKIFPQDVISIPSDYSYQKGRCWKYEVVGEVKDWTKGHCLDKCVDDYKESDNVLIKEYPNFESLTTKQMTNIYNIFYDKNIKHLKTKTEAIKQMKKIYDDNGTKFIKNYILILTFPD